MSSAIPLSKVSARESALSSADRKKDKRIGLARYIFADYLAGVISWVLFFCFRKFKLQDIPFEWSYFQDPNFFLGIAMVPVFWVLLHLFFGTYTDIYRKSRLTEFGKTFLTTLIGASILFFTLILDDWVTGIHGYFYSFSALFALQFIINSIFRMFVLTKANRQIENGEVGYNTLLVGSNKKAVNLYKEITDRDKALGYKFVGFIDIKEKKKNKLESYLPRLGNKASLRSIVEQYQVEEVIVAIETSEHPEINDIINMIPDQEIVIKIIPDMYDILSGSVKMNHVLGAVLIEIKPKLMPEWEIIMKRMFDLVSSGLCLLLLSPLYLFLMIQVKRSSKGPIFYKQERMGLHGKPFHIIKFRSMYVDAEAAGPALSSDDDPRITPIGKILRKYRLDETPQFWNVFKGEMSLVGPRPERRFFFDQIVEKAPAYRHLHKVKPGITSWGMVKYGYAENVDQMIKRMKYDLLYVENMSLAIDLKIMIYTVLILVKGSGK